MREQNLSEMRLGISPCPNDTFIFHALLHGHVSVPGFKNARIRARLADVEQLNRRAIAGEYEVTKLSLGVVPEVASKYALLTSGAALGWACGPLLVARKALGPEEMRGASIAIPGINTTANMLLDLHGDFVGERKEMLFSEVMDAVLRGDADMGLIIHEGRFTYKNRGLVRILDMGEWWESRFHMPLPLGAIAIRRDVARDLALAVQDAIAASLEHAWRFPEHSKGFVRENAREMDEAVTDAHIRTFVTDFSRNLGDSGRTAIETLVGKALAKRGLKDPLFL